MTAGHHSWTTHGIAGLSCQSGTHACARAHTRTDAHTHVRVHRIHGNVCVDTCFLFVPLLLLRTLKNNDFKHTHRSLRKVGQVASEREVYPLFLMLGGLCCYKLILVLPVSRSDLPQVSTLPSLTVFKINTLKVLNIIQCACVFACEGLRYEFTLYKQYMDRQSAVELKKKKKPEALSQQAENKGAAQLAELWPSAASSRPAAVVAGKVRPQTQRCCD